MNINKALSSPVFLVSFFWGLSLVFSLSWVEPHALLRLACIGFLFVASALSLGFALQGSGIGRRSGSLGLLLALFWALAGMSVFWSDIPFVSFISFCTFSLLPLTYYSVSIGNDPYRILKYLTIFSFIFAGLLALFVIAQYFFLTDFLVRGGVRYPFANPNNFAGFFSLVLFGGLAWLMTAPDREQGNAAFVFCALSLAALILLAGRGAFLSFVLGVIVFLAFAGGHTVKKHGRCLSGLFFTGLGTIAAAGLWGGGKTTLWGRLGEVGTQGDVIVFSRTEIWQSTWNMIESHLLTGHGIGTFFLYYPEYRSPAERYSGGFMAHNDPLQFWMEMGILAPVIFYAALFYVLYRGIKALRAQVKREQSYLYLLAVMCGMGAFALHTHITFHFYVAPLLLLFGLALGWWQILTADMNKEPVMYLKWPARFPAAACWFTALLPFCALYVVLQGFLFSEYYADRARAAMMDGRVEAFADDTNKAHHIGFGWNARSYLLAAAIPLGILDDTGAVMMPGEREKLVQQTDRLLDQAERHNPRLVGVLYYRALLEPYKSGRRSRQIKYLQEALRLNPLHLPSREKLLELYQQAGQEDMVLETVKEGLYWDINIYDPVRFYETAIDALEKAGGEAALLNDTREKLEAAFAKKLIHGGVPFMGAGGAATLPAAVPGDSAIVP